MAARPCEVTTKPHPRAATLAAADIGTALLMLVLEQLGGSTLALEVYSTLSRGVYASPAAAGPTAPLEGELARRRVPVPSLQGFVDGRHVPLSAEVGPCVRCADGRPGGRGPR
jgi:hypothetical protein